MTPNVTRGRVRSPLGEHLVAVLLIAIVVLGVLAAYPALATETRGTASKAQERVDLPLVVASYLDDSPAPPKSP